MDTERDWEFTDAADAASYLREVGVLWTTWLVGLVALVAGSGLLVVVLGVLVIAALLWVARPLQARAANLVPEDSVTGGKRSILAGRNTERDLVLRQLAYGDAPLSAAIAVSGSGRWWLTARRVLVGLTIVAFVFVLITLTLGPTPS
jgi:hypothetical protein